MTPPRPTLALMLNYLVKRDGGQAAAARAIDVNPGTMSRWLARQTRPSVNECTKIAGALELSPLYVIAVAYDLEMPSVEDAVLSDPQLAEEAKAHLRAQYRLLRRLNPEVD